MAIPWNIMKSEKKRPKIHFADDFTEIHWTFSYNRTCNDKGLELHLHENALIINQISILYQVAVLWESNRDPLWYLSFLFLFIGCFIALHSVNFIQNDTSILRIFLHLLRLT